jgi:tRNA ligase
MRKWEEPDPDLFHKIIKVQVADAPLNCLRSIVKGLNEVSGLGVEVLRDEILIEALKEAEAYKVSSARHPTEKLGKDIRYYAISVEVDLASTVEHALTTSTSSSTHIAESARALFSTLKSNERISSKPHVTLSHEEEVQAERSKATDGSQTGPQEKRWQDCKAIAESQSSMFEFDLTHLVWDDRVMALILCDLTHQVKLGMAPGVEGEQSELDLPEQLYRQLHVTVGTVSEDIRGGEAIKLVLATRDRIQKGDDEGELGEVVEGGGKVRWIKLIKIKGEGRIKGMW